jgi:hypothetical protein
VDTIVATATNVSDPTQRVRVTIGLRTRVAGEPFLQHGPSFRCAITPADDVAQTYQTLNWESGVVSGAGFAVRRWFSDQQGLSITELDGRLGGDGIEAIALATAAAVAALVGRDPPPPGPAWNVCLEPVSANGANNRYAPAAAAGSSGA